MKYLIALFCLASSLAHSAEPLSIKGVQIGMTQKEVSPKFQNCTKTGCSFFKKYIGDSKRNDMKTLVGADVEYANASFFDGKLDNLHIEIKAGDASNIASAFAEKYGKPKETESQFKTAMGFSGKKYTWAWKIGFDSLRIESPSGSIHEGTVSLVSDAYFARIMEQVKKDKKDL